jgi:hypothetical protein
MLTAFPSRSLRLQRHAAADTEMGAEKKHAAA